MKRMGKLCPFIIEVDNRKVCKFDYINNPFTYRKKMWGECTDNHKRCYSYIKAKKIEEMEKPKNPLGKPGKTKEIIFG